MAAYSSAGRVPLVIWAATVDPADVPMMRSASVTSTPASDRPAMRPSSHAFPAAPPPARTKARLFELPAGLVASTCWSGIGQFPCRGVRVTAMPSEMVVELMRGVEEGVVSMGVAFRGLPVGRSRWRLPQSRDRALQGSTHYGYCVHGSHLLPMDHEHGNDRTPATRCAIGIKPVAVSLPNATPSSVMDPLRRRSSSIGLPGTAGPMGDLRAYPDPGFPPAYGRCSSLSAWWRRAKIAAWTRSCRPSLVRMLRT